MKLWFKLRKLSCPPRAHCKKTRERALARSLYGYSKTRESKVTVKVLYPLLISRRKNVIKWKKKN